MPPRGRRSRVVPSPIPDPLPPGRGSSPELGIKCVLVGDGAVGRAASSATPAMGTPRATGPSAGHLLRYVQRPRGWGGVVHSGAASGAEEPVHRSPGEAGGSRPRGGAAEAWWDPGRSFFSLKKNFFPLSLAGAGSSLLRGFLWTAVGTTVGCSSLLLAAAASLVAEHRL